ncbi:deoxyribodipyrimidine photo-lyase, partial [Alphaproteobacteria bacterium]|nr:deoxyribodipyrimidine photo-lyase [Alphaproteobacteria bacterium]
MSQHIIVWFRQDLRLNDNPALESALNSQAAVIPVYINDNKCGRQ